MIAPWYLELGPLVIERWRIRLRWTTCVIQLAAVAITWLLPNLDIPLGRLAPLVLASALANGGIAAWLSAGHTLPRVAGGFAIALDVALLTGLLEITGGPFNPFSVIYAVYIVLAAFTLGGGWALTVSGVAAAAYGFLLYDHLLPGPAASHHRLNDFPTHLFTMWVTAAAVAELTLHCIGQVSGALARRQLEVDEMRARAARSDRLAALTTLAAGAAHELSTPLATIAVASRELERALAGPPVEPDLYADAELIRTEVDRCQAILDQLSGRAGGSVPDEPELVDVAAVIGRVQDRLVGDHLDRLQVRVLPGIDPLAVPRAGLVQVVSSLLKNAFDASESPRPVMLDVSQNAGFVRLTVRDEGEGMSPDTLQRAGEPFYTTKEPGRGLGLGLFLARVFAERCGGTMTLQSESGVMAVLELPVWTGPEPPP